MRSVTVTSSSTLTRFSTAPSRSIDCLRSALRPVRRATGTPALAWCCVRRKCCLRWLLRRGRFGAAGSRPAALLAAFGGDCRRMATEWQSQRRNIFVQRCSAVADQLTECRAERTGDSIEGAEEAPGAALTPRGFLPGENVRCYFVWMLMLPPPSAVVGIAVSLGSPITWLS